MVVLKVKAQHLQYTFSKYNNISDYRKGGAAPLVHAGVVCVHVWVGGRLTGRMSFGYFSNKGDGTPLKLPTGDRGTNSQHSKEKAVNLTLHKHEN